MNSRRQFAVDPASKHALAVRGLRAAVCCRPAHLRKPAPQSFASRGKVAKA